jgi:voltage-gated potassium channel
MSTSRRALADRYNAFIERHEIAWELVMAALAVAFVVVGLRLEAADDAGQVDPMLEALDDLLTVVFVGEFGTRFAAARSRTAYLRGHWIDAIAMIPAVRGARLLRLARLFRLVRAFSGVFRAHDSIERFATHSLLVGLFVTWLGVAFISGSAFYIAELGTNPNIHAPIDALWWSIVTLTTVGYGDIAPVTPEGRLAGGILMIVGITLWAAITGTITSQLLASQSAGVSIPEQIRQLAELRRDDLLNDDEFETKKAELLARL